MERNLPERQTPDLKRQIRRNNAERLARKANEFDVRIDLEPVTWQKAYAILEDAQDDDALALPCLLLMQLGYPITPTAARALRAQFEAQQARALAQAADELEGKNPSGNRLITNDTLIRLHDSDTVDRVLLRMLQEGD